MFVLKKKSPCVPTEFDGVPVPDRTVFPSAPAAPVAPVAPAGPALPTIVMPVGHVLLEAFGPYNNQVEVLTQKSPRFPSLTPGTFVPLSKLRPAAPVAPAVPTMLNRDEPQPDTVFGPYNIFVLVFTQKSPVFPSLDVGARAPLNILRPSTPFTPLVPSLPAAPVGP